MIDMSNLEEIFAHLEAHPAGMYRSCPCGVEINSYTGWVTHAVLPLIAEALQQGFTAGLNYVAPEEDPQPPAEIITENDVFDGAWNEDDTEVADGE